MGKVPAMASDGLDLVHVPAIVMPEGTRLSNGPAVEWGSGLILDYWRPNKAYKRILSLACLHNTNKQAINKESKFNTNMKSTKYFKSGILKSIAWL